jgi:mannosyltransferase OCH1-like enzyme
MSNDVMFASKGNSFFEDLIEALPTKNKWYGSPYLTVLYSTGPMFLSLVYMNYPFAKEEVLALSPTLYSDTGTRFFCHLTGSTWHGIDAYAAKWLWRNSWFALTAVIVISVYHVRVKIGARLSKSIRLTRRETKSHRLSL